jgi:hypothetical protein
MRIISMQLHPCVPQELSEDQSSDEPSESSMGRWKCTFRIENTGLFFLLAESSTNHEKEVQPTASAGTQHLLSTFVLVSDVFTA